MEKGRWIRVKIALSFLSAFFLVSVFVPPVRRLALSLGWVDRPDGRKRHRGPIPLSGGWALYLAVGTVAVVFGPPHLAPVLVGGGLLLVLIGLVDDGYKARRRELSPMPKLVAQVAAALVPFLAGVRVYGVRDVVDGGMVLFPLWLSLLATVLWVVALINIINFLDGVDGLAAGVTAIAAASLTVIALLKGQTTTPVLTAALVGACLAFLRFNFPPATIFMGDTGSAFLGYVLAVVALDGTLKTVTSLSLAATLLVFGVPLFDSAQVILRRLREGRPIYQADRLHVHHRLLAHGLTQVQTLAVLYGVSFLLSMVSLLLYWWVVG
ncbi:MraY family glycosyltransferase [Calditerricola satsumensis]